MNRIIEVIIGLKRNIAMAIASMVLIFLTLFVLGFSVIIMGNINHISTQLIESLSIYVYIDEEVDKKSEEEIISQINDLEGVGQITLSDKEEQLDKVTQIWGKDGEMFKKYFSGEKNPLNDVLTVEAQDDSVNLENLTIQINSIKGVEDADYGEDAGADQLVEALRKLQVTSILISVIFAVITVFLIISTIKLTINSRRKEIEIMRLVGATKSYITFPFAVEGMILGLIGGLLAFGMTAFAYNKIWEGSGFVMSMLVQPQNIIFPLVLSQIIFGLLIGFLSSLIAIRSYLKV